MTAASRAAKTLKRTAGGREPSFRQQSLPLARLAGLRESAYRALSQSFLSPTEDTLTVVASHLEEWMREPSIPAEFSFWTQMARLHAIWDRMDEQKLMRLQTRYVALFATATGGVPCPPYESVYVAKAPGEEGLVLAAIERDYATVGLYRSPDQKLSPDHISMELEFMAITCGREAKAWESKKPKRAVRLLEKEARFLHQHLGSWLPAFARDVDVADAGSVYSMISAAALAFVTHDCDLGGELAAALASQEDPT